MGNCCASPAAAAGPRTPKQQQQRANPYEISALHTAGTLQLSVLGHLWHTLGIQVQDNILEKYALGKELGRGEFGITYLCTDRVSGDVFACKSISKRKLRTAVDIEDVRREAIIMHQLPPHPNIVSLKGLYEDDNAVHLVMEFCEGGELFDRIVARGHYNERAAASITRTIVEVVQACHKNGVMHRDLKPENFLFANKRENSPLKAIDFGLSVFFKPGEKFSEIVGSPYYMAPEILKRNYGPEVDIWSAGVILYILLSGLPPFWAETEQGVAQAILQSVINFRAEPWPKISDKAKSLVRQMLEPDPRKRLSPQQVLDHPWLQNTRQAPETSLGETVRSRLRQFSAMNKLRKKALRVIAELLSGDEVETIKTMFMTMDTQKRGYLSFDEFLMGLRKFGSQLTDTEIQHLMEDVGAQRNGYLDYGKFVALTIQLQRLDTDEYLRKAFDYFDIDGNGFIDINELKQSLNDDLGPDDLHLVRDIMQEVDVDKDGRISYEEFASMMQAGTDWRKFSRRYSRERFNNLSIKLMNDGSLSMHENGQMR